MHSNVICLTRGWCLFLLCCACTYTFNKVCSECYSSYTCMTQFSLTAPASYHVNITSSPTMPTSVYTTNKGAPLLSACCSKILLNSQRVTTSVLTVRSHCYSQVVWEQGYGVPTLCYSRTSLLWTSLIIVMISGVSIFIQSDNLGLVKCPD